MNQKILLFLLVLQCFSLILSLSKTFHASNDDFGITVNSDGSYQVKIRNVTWLYSYDTYLHANGVTNRLVDGGLVLIAISNSTGVDILGRWQAKNFSYVLQNDTQTQFDCVFVVYLDLSLIRFTQHFKNGANLTQMQYNFQSSSSFPSFSVQKIDNQTTGYLSYGGMMCGDMEKVMGLWDELAGNVNGGMSGGPLILYNVFGDTLVLSPMSGFMSANMYHDNIVGGSVNFGIMGGVNQIPENYTVDFMVYYSSEGINKAMEGWGSSLQTFYEKKALTLQTDFTNNYLGYWTDNGAYYYWQTENGTDYQETILNLVDEFNSLSIPFRYFQYDSWWYDGPLGVRGGCSFWNCTPVSHLIPNGMKYIYEKTKLPASAHNKYWDQGVKYATQNGGNYNFVIDSRYEKALPDDQQFWDYLMQDSAEWGLLTYEQDWMNHQTLDFTPLYTDIDLGRRWLKQMGNAAEKFNITIQYCMSLSRHVLASVEIQAVTQVRVTNDYATNWQYGGEQWRIGISSIFAYSVGLAPFKDVYWSTENQPGNRYGKKAKEPYSALESAISTLSAGPVGPGDKIDCMNKDIIMRCCNDDGLILKPSKPITAIDAQIYQLAIGQSNGNSPFGEVWSTYSKINELIFGIVLAIDMRGDFIITPTNCGFDVSQNTVFWKYGDYRNIYPFTNSMEVAELKLDTNCTKKDFCLYFISPVFSINGRDVVFLGELIKWVPVSSKRVQLIQSTSSSLVVYINGSINEKIQFAFSIDNKAETIECDFGNYTQLKIMLNGSDLTCN